MRGRKPKSSAQRRLLGNPGHRPFNPVEPQHAAPDPEFDIPPRELDGHERAREEWTRLAPLLRRSRQVSSADRTALIALCLEWDLYLEASAKIQTLVVRTPAGYPMINPYRAIASRALAACTKLWPELGLTPSSRARVQVSEPPAADDPFAEFDAPLPRTGERAH